jgi:formate/nitrite transporter FocA (FNT family)
MGKIIQYLLLFMKSDYINFNALGTEFMTATCPVTGVFENSMWERRHEDCHVVEIRHQMCQTHLECIYCHLMFILVWLWYFRSHVIDRTI